MAETQTSAATEMNSVKIHEAEITKLTVRELIVNKTPVAGRDKISSNSLLVLTWTALVLLAVNAVVGFVSLSGEDRWVRLTFFLGMAAGLMILVCILIFIMAKLRMES